MDPASRFRVIIRTSVKSQEYVECRGSRGTSRLTDLRGYPKKKLQINNVQKKFTNKLIMEVNKISREKSIKHTQSEERGTYQKHCFTLVRLLNS